VLGASGGSAPALKDALREVARDLRAMGWLVFVNGSL